MNDLGNHHRTTVDEIFRHPAGRNVEWRKVLSLLEAVGSTVRERNGKFKVTIGAETEVLVPPDGKDIDQQMIVDLRRMLASAGYGPGGAADAAAGAGV